MLKYSSFTAKNAGIIFLFVGISFSLLYFYPSSWPLHDLIKEFYANVSVEFVSISITVLIIDKLNQLRHEEQVKEQLLREMGSLDNGIALRAVKELEVKKCLSDGTLIEASLQNANLENANLSNANLQCAKLKNANLQKVNFLVVVVY